MHSNLFGNWSEMGKFSFAPWIEMNGIATKMMTNLTRENLESMNEWMQSFSEYTQSLTQAKGIEEVVSLQAEFATKTAPLVCQHAQHVMDTVVESMMECKKCFEKGLEKKSQDKSAHYHSHHK